MKDSEFIELLNLYLDHEISAKDAVRLEAEVQSNPARRRIYQDYCRMQKACKVLAQDFQTETPEAAEKKVVAFRPETAARASRGNAFYTFGAVAAAAACVAIIFIGRSRQQEHSAVPNAPIVAQPVAATETKTSAVAIDTPQAQARASRIAATNVLHRNDGVQATLLGTSPLFLSQNTAAATTTPSAQQANDQFTWLRTPLGLVSLEQQLQLEQMRFQTAPMTLQPGGRTLGNRPPNKSQEAGAEMSAFQFRLGH